MVAVACILVESIVLTITVAVVIAVVVVADDDDDVADDDDLLTGNVYFLFSVFLFF